MRVNISQAGMQQLVTNPAAPTYRQMVAIGTAVTSVAKGLAPVDTGRLRQSGDLEMVESYPELTARIKFTARHAYVVHKGHGEIRPRRARVLAWRRGGRWNYAQRVRPVAGRPFLTEAVVIVTGKVPRGGAR